MNDEHIPLSEAIREGSKLKPQGFGWRLDRADKETSCALEAAAEAIYGTANLITLVDARPRLSVLDQHVRCPVCKSGRDVQGAIVHLNDQHHWTREQIADWLEPIERV